MEGEYIYEHFYDLAVQARLYCDMIECLNSNTVAQVQSPARAKVISIFSPVTFMAEHTR